MNRATLLLLGLALAAGAPLSFGTGCAKGTVSMPTGSGGGATGKSGTGGAGGVDAGDGDADDGDAGDSTTVMALDCASYCSEIMTNCTDTNQQFGDMDSCLGTCAGYPPGTLADTSGDTLGCRIYHGGAPAMADPVMHCPHAGITGGDKDPMGTAGTCGEPCDAFCEVALMVCAGQPNAYADSASCLTECLGFPADAASFSTADTANDDMGCRMYHLTAAAESTADAVVHCAHIHEASPVCTM